MGEEDGESVGVEDGDDAVGVVEVVTGVSEVLLLTGGEEDDETQSPKRFSRQLGGMDVVAGGGELVGVVVGGVDVGVSVVGDDDEELPGSVVVDVGVVVGDEEEEEGGSLVDGVGVVDDVSDDEGVVLVDGGSVFVGSVVGSVGEDDEPGGVEDEEVGPGGENMRRDETRCWTTYLGWGWSHCPRRC